MQASISSFRISNRRPAMSSATDTLTQAATDAAPLYRRLLGRDWERLPPKIQALHLTEEGLRARGKLHIRHGTGRLAPLLIAAFRLPAPASSCPTTLEVTPVPAGERWIRRFGAHTLTSTQRTAGRGLLVERIGALALRFR